MIVAFIVWERYTRPLANRVPILITLAVLLVVAVELVVVVPPGTVVVVVPEGGTMVSWNAPSEPPHDPPKPSTAIV